MSYLVKPNIITVAYEELHPSPVENFARDRISSVRTFKCAWNKRWLLCTQLLGWVEKIGAYNVIHQAHSYKVEEMKNPFYCEEILSVKGFGGLVESPVDTKVAEYTEAELTVLYQVSEYDIATDPALGFISESIEPVTDYITLNNEHLYWDNSQTTKVESVEAPALINKMFDWVYTIHKVAFLPVEMFSLTGYINSVAIYSRSLNIIFAVGSLLLGDPVISREHTPMGLTMWRVTIRLTAKEQGWNNFPKVDTVDAYGNMWWGPIFNDSGTIIYPYSYGNFSNLII